VPRAAWVLHAAAAGNGAWRETSIDLFCVVARFICVVVVGWPVLQPWHIVACLFALDAVVCQL